MSADWGGSAVDTAECASAGFPTGRPAPAGSTRPVAAPGPGSVAGLLPLPSDAVRLGPGFWHERTAVNAGRSLEAGLARLEAAGTLDNLKLAAGTAQGEYHGRLPFLDTDVFKWLEAVSWQLQHDYSAEWSARADEVIALVAAAQEPDGYLNSHTAVVRGGQRWVDLAMGHEMYCAGHLIQAGVAHSRATGRDALLSVARRFADLLVAEFGEGGARTGYCGHPEVETALVELFRETGERAYLDLARHLIDVRGSGLLGDRPFGRRYFQDLVPVRETTTMQGHAVRALYLAAGVTDVYLETGEKALLETVRCQWDDLLRGKAYITGGTGARHRDEAFGDAFELPSDQAYTETCAAIALMQWAWRLLLATGESQYADMFERVLYNGFLAGVSLDGERYFYVNPLQVRSDSTLGPAGRQEWFSCACCPPNVMRTLASLTHYFATSSDEGLQIHQYAEGGIRAVPGTGAQTVGVDVTTEYPHAGAVHIRIPEDCAGHWTLSLRIPSWARDTARLSVDGENVPLRGNGYVRLTRTWQGTERVELDLPTDARLTVADPRVDALRGCAAVERGPLVYCAEQRDQSADLDQVGIIGIAGEGDPIEVDGVLVRAVLLNAHTDSAHTESAPRGSTRPDSAQPEPVADSWPYRELGAAAHPGEHARRVPVTVTTIPYFAWANRGQGAMRVWLPVAPEPGAPAEESVTSRISPGRR